MPRRLTPAALSACLLALTLTAPPASAMGTGGRVVKVHVLGMVCAFCAQGLARKLREHPAVKELEASFEESTVYLTLRDGRELTTREVQDMVQDAGFEADRVELPAPLR